MKTEFCWCWLLSTNSLAFGKMLAWDGLAACKRPGDDSVSNRKLSASIPICPKFPKTIHGINKSKQYLASMKRPFRKHLLYRLIGSVHQLTEDVSSLLGLANCLPSNGTSSRDGSPFMVFEVSRSLSSKSDLGEKLRSSVITEDMARLYTEFEVRCLIEEAIAPLLARNAQLEAQLAAAK